MEYVSYEELYEAYLECRKNKRTSRDSLDFELNENQNLYQLWIELNTKTYTISPSIGFICCHPVYREVFAAQYRDRIVHHLICRRLNKYFESHIIYDSYSCIKGKGTLFGQNRFAEQLADATNNYTKEVFAVRGDLTSFFISISKDVLFEKIRLFVEDNYESEMKDWMLWLIKTILYNRPQDNFINKSTPKLWSKIPPHKLLVNVSGDYALPVGNLPSQLWTTIYMTDFDKSSLDYPGIMGYGRYVDDFFAIFESHTQAEQYIKWSAKILSKIHLKLNIQKTKIYSSDEPIPFIGVRFEQGKRKVVDRTLNNIKKSITDINNGAYNKNTLSRLNSIVGYLKYYDEDTLKESIFDSVLKSHTCFCVSKDKNKFILNR